MPVPKGEVMYSCPGGMDFASSFSDDGELATLRMPGQPDIELSRVPAGSGFAYSDSYYELRGRGREGTLTAAGRSMRCHAAGRRGADRTALLRSSAGMAFRQEQEACRHRRAAGLDR